MPFITRTRLNGLEEDRARAIAERKLYSKASEADSKRLEDLTRLVPALSKYHGQRCYFGSDMRLVKETAWNDKLINDTIAALDRQKQADQDAKLIANAKPAPATEPRLATGGYTGRTGLDFLASAAAKANDAETATWPKPRLLTIELSEEDRKLLRDAANLQVTIPNATIGSAVKGNPERATTTPKRDAALREHAATIIPSLADDEAWKNHAEWVIHNRIPAALTLESAKSRLSDFADGFQAGRAAGRAGKKAAK